MLELLGTRTTDGAVGSVDFTNSAGGARLVTIRGLRDRANTHGAFQVQVAGSGTLVEALHCTPAPACGIGTSNPIEFLHVVNDIHGGVVLQRTLRTEATDLYFATGRRGEATETLSDCGRDFVIRNSNTGFPRLALMSIDPPSPRCSAAEALSVHANKGTLGRGDAWTGIAVPARTIGTATSGSHARISGMELSPPTISAKGATVAEAATLTVMGAPTGAGASHAVLVKSGSLRMDGGPLASLGAPPNGTMIYCADCTLGTNPCAAGGTGAYAQRLDGAWTCGTGGRTFTMQLSGSSFDPPAAKTLYVGSDGDRPSESYDANAWTMPVAATLRSVAYSIYARGRGSAESVRHTIRKNDTLDAASWRVAYSSGFERAVQTELNIPVAAGDTVALKVGTPSWASPPKGVRIRATLYFSVP